MAKRKISLIWEGELGNGDVEIFEDDPALCVEFLTTQSNARLIVSEGDKVLSEYCMDDDPLLQGDEE